jgi:hypothetical protein
MPGQQVENQWNVAGDLNIGMSTVQSPVALVDTLKQFNKWIAQARGNGILDEETATDVQYQVTKAVQQAKKSSPDKKTILDHLATAKSILEGVTAASGLVTALMGAIETVQKLF